MILSSIILALFCNSSSGRVMMPDTRAQHRERNSMLLSRSASNARRYFSRSGPIRPWSDITFPSGESPRAPYRFSLRPSH